MQETLFVVTGGSRGIGAATALLASRRGWPVVIGVSSFSVQ